LSPGHPVPCSPAEVMFALCLAYRRLRCIIVELKCGRSSLFKFDNNVVAEGSLELHSGCATGQFDTPVFDGVESVVGRRSSESCEESLVEFIHTPAGGSSVATTVVLSRGVWQSRVRAVQDVSTSPVPVRRHSQSVSQWFTVMCPTGGAVPRRRSSGSVRSGRSRLSAKKREQK